MARFLLVVRVFFVLFSFQNLGRATRYLPMVVWDHLNPQLSCKCNWLTIPKIDKYDELGFLCPSLKNVVKLLNGYSRPTSNMNENIFRRKWKRDSGNLDQLSDSLRNGSFCDPAQANKIYSCKGGVEGRSKVETFSPSSGYNKGDIFVFFNNGDGEVRTLTSNKKECTMVFVVNVTSELEVEHDMSYGKCLKPDDKNCDNINTTCRSTCDGCISPRMQPSPTSKQTSSAGNKPTVALSSPSSSSLSPCSTIANQVTSENIPSAEYTKPKKSNDVKMKYFGYGMMAGIVICFFIFALIMLLKVLKNRKQSTEVPSSAEERLPMKNTVQSKENAQQEKPQSENGCTVPLV